MYHLQDSDCNQCSRVIFDSGAYLSLSPHKDDFVGPIETVFSCNFNSTVSGVSDNLLRVQGVLKMNITVYTGTGNRREIDHHYGIICSRCHNPHFEHLSLSQGSCSTRLLFIVI